MMRASSRRMRPVLCLVCAMPIVLVPAGSVQADGYYRVSVTRSQNGCALSTVHSARTGVQSWVGNDVLRAISAWNGPSARLNVGARQEHGYPHKVLWQTRGSLRQTVTLRGWNATTGRRVWFVVADQGPGTQRPGSRAVLDPRYANALQPGNRTWLGYSSMIYIPDTGCYTLHARWHTGSWTGHFTIGAKSR